MSIKLSSIKLIKAEQKQQQKLINTGTGVFVFKNNKKIKHFKIAVFGAVTALFWESWDLILDMNIRIDLMPNFSHNQ